MKYDDEKQRLICNRPCFSITYSVLKQKCMKSVHKNSLWPFNRRLIFRFLNYPGRYGNDRFYGWEEN